MGRLQFCVLGVLLLSVSGCAHVNESSRSASISQIETHLAPITGSTSLQLTAVDENRFAGTGKNSSGEFTIEVTRKQNEISFSGAYIPPAKGNFNGTASWSKRRTSFLGLKLACDSANSTFSTQERSTQ